MFIFTCTCEEKLCTLPYQDIEKDKQTTTGLRASLKANSPIFAILFDDRPALFLILLDSYFDVAGLHVLLVQMLTYSCCLDDGNREYNEAYKL